MKSFHSLSKSLAGATVLAVSLASTGFASNTLLGLWRFNDGTGTTAADSSGAGNNGTLGGENGNIPAWVPGQAGFGSCLRFTNTAAGASSGGDRAYVNIPASPGLKIGMTPTNTWSYTCWAYEVSAGSGNYLDYYGRIFTQDGGQGLQWESGATIDPQFYVWHGVYFDWQFGLGLMPSLDEWVHYALVYDGTNVTMYRNGGTNSSDVTIVPVAGGAGAGLDFSGYDGAFTIGSQTDYGIFDGSRTFNGMLDDFAIFQGALSQSEIRTIMTGDFSAYLGGPPNIVAQPQSQVVNQGLDATLTVSATSQTPLTYQWQFNGADLSGKTDSTLTLTNVQSSQAGNYSVKVHNTSGTTPSSNAVLTVLIPLPPQLVGLWRFDEGSGTNVADSSGLTNNGVLAAAIDDVTPGTMLPTWAPGQAGFGNALQFTDNEAEYDFVYVQPNDSLKIGMTANDLWTITAWTKELSDGSGNFVSHYGRVFAYDFGWGLNFNSGYTGDVQYYIWHNTFGTWTRGFGTDAAVVPVLDQWVHLALVYDGRNLTLFKNGNNQAKNGAKTSLPAHDSVAFTDHGGYDGSLQIGSVLNEPLNHNWNGLLDDVAIFTGALTESQIQTVMGGDFSAFLNNKPLLSLNTSGSQVVISWTYGILQSTTTLPSGWQDIPTATSPLILSPSDAPKFYRVRRAL